MFVPSEDGAQNVDGLAQLHKYTQNIFPNVDMGEQRPSEACADTGRKDLPRCEQKIYLPLWLTLCYPFTLIDEAFASNLIKI